MTILVDSGVWIDYLNGRPSPQADMLDVYLLGEDIKIADLVLVEVLQGVRYDKKFEALRRRLDALPIVRIADRKIAVEAARNYRSLRARGITVRKTIDCLIATRCIVEDWPLLYSDRDFDPFVAHLGLRSALVEAG